MSGAESALVPLRRDLLAHSAKDGGIDRRRQRRLRCRRRRNGETATTATVLTTLTTSFGCGGTDPNVAKTTDSTSSRNWNPHPVASARATQAHTTASCRDGLGAWAQLAVPSVAATTKATAAAMKAMPTGMLTLARWRRQRRRYRHRGVATTTTRLQKRKSSQNLLIGGADADHLPTVQSLRDAANRSSRGTSLGFARVWRFV